LDLEQIFAYAIDQEVKAEDFYRSSAEQTSNAEARSLFKNLATMEITHQRVLRNQLNILSKTGALKIENIKVPAEQREMLASLKQVTRVLKEANVELVEEQKKTQAELETAARIQNNLLPTKVPQLLDLEISVACFMAGQVGGDYYDYLFNPLGHLNITIGDVSGKGMPAALLMVAVRTLWRSKVRDGNPPERILELLTQDLSPEFSENEQFITIISGAYNYQQHIFSFSNAGHWPPLHFSAKSGQFSPLSPGTLPIGIDIEANYYQQELKLFPGDLIVLFSDGIIEARNMDTREFFGEERLNMLVADNYRLNAQEIRDVIVDKVQSFSHGKRSDDQTLMVMKRKNN